MKEAVELEALVRQQEGYKKKVEGNWYKAEENIKRFITDSVNDRIGPIAATVNLVGNIMQIAEDVLGKDALTEILKPTRAHVVTALLEEEEDEDFLGSLSSAFAIVFYTKEPPKRALALGLVAKNAVFKVKNEAEYDRILGNMDGFVERHMDIFPPELQLRILEAHNGKGSCFQVS